METSAIAAIPDEPLRTLTWIVLGLFALGLPLVLARVVLGLWRGSTGDSGERATRAVLFAAMGLGAALRLLVRPRMVMHYMGYELYARAARLGVTPKYGPSAFQLEHVALYPGGMDAVFAMHAVMGGLMAPLAALLVMRLGATGPAVAWVGSAVALAPVLIRDAASESLLVPTTFWVLGAAVMLAESLRTGRPLPLLGAGLWLLLAMLGRPEMFGAGPLLLALVVLRTPSPRRWHFAAAGFALAALVAVMGLRLEQLGAQLVLERLRGNTPRVFQQGQIARVAQLLREAWWDKNGLLWPGLFPVAALVAIPLGAWCARGRDRQLVLAFAALAMVWLAPTALDLPWVSVPRVQAPAMLVALMAAGCGFAALQQAARRAGRLGPRGAAAVPGIALALTAAFTLPGAFREDHTDLEDQTLRTALARLPAEAVVVARGHDDPPDERVHLAMPRPVLPIRALLEGRIDPTRRPVYAWLGTRCFMRSCAAAGEHPACAAVRRRFVLRPVTRAPVEIPPPRLPDTFGRAPARHPGAVADLDFPWCLVRSRFVIGMYRVSGRLASPPNARRPPQ